jgi:serine protease inhibitor
MREKHPCTVFLQMIEYGIKNLSDSLQYLGMEEAFIDRADFSFIRDDFINILQ